MRRFLAAWDAFWDRWDDWDPQHPYRVIFSSGVPITDRQKKDLQAVIDGVSTAHRKPKRQEGML
jgi:hypothetical protein